ncbi:MAG: 4-hydroxythreonine-4-phosphate dehydrogenase PdxA [Elusimicrobia bacterium]|nr:4-hydroxythreonine-4-phosphate dehydrogenase PdxA [Elusimicrobiota bacterium]
MKVYLRLATNHGITLKPKLLITAGDPLGIGPEIAVKAARSASLRAAAELFIAGDSSALVGAGWSPELCPMLAVDAPGLDLSKKRPTAAAGLASYKAVLAAWKLLKTGAFDALVTAPICKAAWKMAGARQFAHTDLFRALENEEPLMIFSRGAINAALVTEHLPLKDLPKKITPLLIEQKALLFAGALKRLGIKRPRVAVCALNPHAGDGGLLGREEITVILPALRKLKARGLGVLGPYGSDTAWEKHLNGEADGVLCLYHDQALVPLKICGLIPPPAYLPKANLQFEAGGGIKKAAVHWTWGLSFIRTSPAHGTAFDIAGKGLADAQGMIGAALFAVKLATHSRG